MRSSRTREVRRGSRRPLYLTLMLLLVLAAGVGVAYFVQGFGPLAAKTAPAEQRQVQIEQPVILQEPALVEVAKPPANQPASDAVHPEPNLSLIHI